jgi:predicted nucleic acid-binding protein
MTYYDSCYLAKLYLMEPDSPRVRAHAATAGELVCCATGWGEVLCTLHRHLREKRLTAREFRLLAAQVEADRATGVWTALPVTAAMLDSQAQRIARLPENVFLRAADALHLSCASDARLTEIFTSDRHLSAAAPHFGIKATKL